MPSKMDKAGKESQTNIKNDVIKENLKNSFGQNAQKAWREYEGMVGLHPAGVRYDPKHPDDLYNPHYCQCPFPKVGLPIREYDDYINHNEDRCTYHVKSGSRQAPFEAAAHAQRHFEWWYEMNKIVENGVERPPENDYPVVPPQWSKDGPMSPEDMLRKKMREKIEADMVEEEHKQEIEDAKTDFSEEKRRVGRPPKVTV